MRTNVTALPVIPPFDASPEAIAKHRIDVHDYDRALVKQHKKRAAADIIEQQIADAEAAAVTEDEQKAVKRACTHRVLAFVKRFGLVGR